LAQRGAIDAAALAFLGRTFDLSAADLRHIRTGEVLARSLDAADKREVALLGIVRVAITPELYAARVADVVNFKKADAVLQVGIFDDPPTADGLRGLSLDPADRDDLQACRIGHCAMQLPADAIQRFGALNWSAAGSSEEAQRLLRDVLAGVAAAYRASGNSGLITYADSRPGTVLADEFEALVASDQTVLPRFPAVRQRLAEYPFVGDDKGVDVLYWSKEKLGPATVISITHLTIVRTASRTPAAYVITSQQIYASHYFDTSLGVTILFEGDSTSPATYLAYLNRSRLDTFTGLLGGIKRALVRRRARAAVEDYLRQVKTTLEHDVRQR
jgi:hypothetical protein